MSLIRCDNCGKAIDSIETGGYWLHTDGEIKKRICWMCVTVQPDEYYNIWIFNERGRLMDHLTMMHASGWPKLNDYGTGWSMVVTKVKYNEIVKWLPPYRRNYGTYSYDLLATGKHNEFLATQEGAGSTIYEK